MITRLVLLIAVIFLLVQGALYIGANHTPSVVATYTGNCENTADVMCAADMRRGMVQQRPDVAAITGNWSRTELKTVFRTSYPGNIHLYDGETTIKLTDDADHNAIPALSPDGETLVYANVVPMTGDMTLKLMTLSNRGTRALPTPQGRNFGAPIWSPDGSAFLYLTVLLNNSTQIWRIDTAGSEPLRLGVAASNHVAWSPDSSRVAYIGADGVRLFINDAATGERLLERQIGTMHTALQRLIWLPDGEHLAYIHEDLFDSSARTEILHIESGKVTELRHPDYRSYGGLYPVDERFLLQHVVLGYGANSYFALLLLDIEGEQIYAVRVENAGQVLGTVVW